MLNVEAREFRISEAYVDQRRKLMKFMTYAHGAMTLFITGVAAFSIFQMVSFSLKSGYRFFWSDLLFFLVPTAFPVAMFALLIFKRRIAKRMICRLEEQRIKLTDFAVQREREGQREIIPHSDVVNIRVNRDTTGHLAQVSLRTETQDYIFDGLEDFETFLQALQDRLFKVRVSEQRRWWRTLDRVAAEHFSLYIVVCVVLGLVTMYLLSTQLPTLFGNLVQALGAIGVAIFALVKRPASDGMVKVKTQREVHVAFLLLGVAMLAMLFF